MIGFCPGFPYLGGMDERIATPRRKEPRLVIPAGSIGIAGKQTGGYPISTPGGWQLIGRTPLNLFDLKASSPSLLHSGDLVKFVPISPEEYQRLKEDKV
jgi:inhibitor of KinA